MPVELKYRIVEIGRDELDNFQPSKHVRRSFESADEIRDADLDFERNFSPANNYFGDKSFGFERLGLIIEHSDYPATKPSIKNPPVEIKYSPGELKQQEEERNRRLQDMIGFAWSSLEPDKRHGLWEAVPDQLKGMLTDNQEPQTEVEVKEAAQRLIDRLTGSNETDSSESPVEGQ